MRELDRSKALATGVVIASGLAGCVTGCTSDDPEKALPVGYCRSDPIEQVYKGDPKADEKDQKTWKTGVPIITRNLPRGILGVEITYRNPHSPEPTDTSQPVPRHLARLVGMRIGKRKVTFGAQIVAEDGSGVCNIIEDAKPDTTFGKPQPFRIIQKRGAIEPDFASDPLPR